jgi:hypothetical protein
MCIYWYWYDAYQSPNPIAAQLLQYGYSASKPKSSAYVLLISSYLGQNPSGTLARRVKILRITKHILLKAYQGSIPWNSCPDTIGTVLVHAIPKVLYY